MSLLATNAGHPVIAIVSDGVQYAYDYDKDGSYAKDHYAKLSGTSMWSDTTNSKPLTDLNNARKKLQKQGKIAIELNLASQINTQLTPIVTTTDIKKEVEKKEVGNSFNKNEPVAPVIKKTFAKAYKEWLADEPVGGSGNVYMVWYAKEPNLADYADGRAFLAKKEAWEKKKPDYNAYLAKTNYASDYEKWQAKEPKLADYTILVGTKTAEEKYNEDFAKWQELTPKPEDYITYTSFETDYNAWLAAAPVPVEGKYETAIRAQAIIL